MRTCRFVGVINNARETCGVEGEGGGRGGEGEGEREGESGRGEGEGVGGGRGVFFAQFFTPIFRFLKSDV